jgi:hypothetical protein
MVQYDVKGANEASIREIFFDKNTNKLSYKNEYGIIVAFAPPVSSLPFWLEFNETDLTIWNNGKANIASTVSFGPSALKNNTFGNDTVAIGNRALESNTWGNNSVAVGSLALLSQIGQNGVITANTAIGGSALNSTTTGRENTGIGSASFNSNTTGIANVGLGYLAGMSNTTGSGNIAIGHTVSTGNFSNSVIIGRGATATGSNQFVIGSAGYNAGTVTTEAVSSTKTWTVVINGVVEKILLR